MSERIQRKRTAGWRAPAGAKYVGRGSKFGNPNRITPSEGGWSVIHDNGGAVGIFGVKADAHRFAVDAYRHHLDTHPELVQAARTELAGRDLLCWCAEGLPCHGDLLLAAAAGGGAVNPLIAVLAVVSALVVGYWAGRVRPLTVLDDWVWRHDPAPRTVGWWAREAYCGAALACHLDRGLAGAQGPPCGSSWPASGARLRPAVGREEAAVIETAYRVLCSGPCRRYLTPDGPQKSDWPDLGEYDTREAAEAAATVAGWKYLFPLDHGYKAGWLGDDQCCRSLPMVGMMQGYCTRPIADHQLVGPYCPDCAPGALAAARAAQQAWWAEEVQRRAVAAGEG